MYLLKVVIFHSYVSHYQRLFPLTVQVDLKSEWLNRPAGSVVWGRGSPQKSGHVGCPRGRFRGVDEVVGVLVAPWMILVRSTGDPTSAIPWPSQVALCGWQYLDGEGICSRMSL